jgi:RHS repeat-associated protein
VSGLNDADGVTTFGYLTGDPTNRVAQIGQTPTVGPTQELTYTYDGSLVSGLTATGAAPAQVSYAFDNNFLTTSMNLTSGTDTIQTTLAHDRDGLLSGFGPFTFTRGGPGGALSQISDGTVSTTYGYDAWARISTRSHQVNGQAVYSMQLTYDLAGRITGKTETINGAAHTYVYAYDLDGQLTGVTRDNVAVESYGYDANGNRTSRQLGLNPVETAGYDAQDRLTLLGAVVYQFDSDGFLTQRGSDAFHYNARGQLLQAVVAGQPVSYAYDGLGRRVSRTDGNGTTQYLYGDPSSPLVTAVRSPAGSFTAFYYDTAGLLIALERGGVRYDIATDQVGTPRVITDSTGAIVKTLEYDAFGNIVTDSNPTFDLPIGYAGGLADPATGLVHFGARDYDPAAGRWTARDPALFGGGQGNLFVYVGNDPINDRDPSGLFCISVSVYDGIGGGVQTCITEDGASVCGEVGFGIGASVGVDNGGVQKSGDQIGGELGVKCGPVKVGGKVSLDDTGCLKAEPVVEAELGPISLEANGDVKLKPEVENKPKVKLSTDCALGGKIAGKVCTQGKF